MYRASRSIERGGSAIKLTSMGCRRDKKSLFFSTDIS
jgi:hypothetical protein